MINDVDSDTLAETVADFQTEGMSAIGLEADVSDPDEVDALFDEIEDQFGNLDVLVNNAAVIDSAAYNEITPDKWRRVLSVDLDGVHYCCSAGAPLLTDSENGSIVNVWLRSLVSESAYWPGHITRQRNGELSGSLSTLPRNTGRTKCGRMRYVLDPPKQLVLRILWILSNESKLLPKILRWGGGANPKISALPSRFSLREWHRSLQGPP